MKRSSISRRLALLAISAGVAWCQLAAAQSAYPSRTILMVVPQTAGGTNDIVGRVVSQKLSEVLGSPVAVENRPGAGGNIGTQFVGKSAKDGYTLLMTISSSQAINPALYKNPGFDPVKDFKPVALIGAVPNVLLAHPDFPVKSVKDLIALAKEHKEYFDISQDQEKVNDITQDEVEDLFNQTPDITTYMNGEYIKSVKLFMFCGIIACPRCIISLSDLLE
jgi:tripartite-type tricarboxylate transporter receptor subunit TctC